MGANTRFTATPIEYRPDVPWAGKKGKVTVSFLSKTPFTSLRSRKAPHFGKKIQK